MLSQSVLNVTSDELAKAKEKSKAKVHSNKGKANACYTTYAFILVTFHVLCSFSVFSKREREREREREKAKKNSTFELPIENE